MSRTHKCPVHGENGFDQEKAGTHIPEPLADCTCDVGATGPAAEGKGNTPVRTWPGGLRQYAGRSWLRRRQHAGWTRKIVAMSQQEGGLRASRKGETWEEISQNATPASRQRLRSWLQGVMPRALPLVWESASAL